MASIYKKTMREALEEARNFRDTSDIEEGYPMSYDEWLKKEKGIKKGAHGVNSDEHAKYSREWRASVGKHYDNLPSAKGAKNVTKLSPTAHTKLGENELDEIVGGKGEMTITKDGGVMIIKTRDWQTYKAKGWVKREEVGNESLELPATGAITSNSTGQEDDSEELTEGRVIIATDNKTKKKWQFSGGMKVKHDGKTYDTEGVTTQQVLELSSRQGDIKLGKKDIEDGFAKGTFSVVNDGSVYQPWKNDFEPEGEQELDEAWNEKLSIKALGEYRKVYEMMKKTGVRPEFIKRMEKFYDDLVIGGMYSSRMADEKGILKIDGRTKYKNQNW